jgi:hypothetical protein
MLALLGPVSCGAPEVEEATAGESDALSHAELPGPDAQYFTLGHFTTNAMVAGELEADGSAEFVLGEEEGSLMMVHIMTPELDAADVSVYRMDTGAAVADLAPTGSYFEGRLPATTGYKIEVNAAGAATEYSIEVEVPRVLDLEGQTADISSWLPPHAPLTYVIEEGAGRTLQVSLAGAPEGAYLTLHALADGTVIQGATAGVRSIESALSDGAYLLRIHGGDEAGEFTLNATLQ